MMKEFIVRARSPSASRGAEQHFGSQLRKEEASVRASDRLTGEPLLSDPASVAVRKGPSDNPQQKIGAIAKANRKAIVP